jgi:hypothetical protein
MVILSPQGELLSENILLREGISADVIWGTKYEKVEKKKEDNVNEKGEKIEGRRKILVNRVT